MSSNKALVVLSGGQDSTTCLAWASKYFSEVHAITFDYGQRHQRELQAAKDVARIFGVKSHEIMSLGRILKGRSPLTDHSAQLEQYADHESMEKIIGDRVEVTFVPMRNALFFTLAANHAICLDIRSIVTGICAADNANYPDCTPAFAKAQEQAINEALGIKDFAIFAPLLYLSKPSSIGLMKSFGPEALASLAFTHTAYDGQYPPVGKDHATILRAQGILEANLPDPLVLRAVASGLMSLPASMNYASPEVNLSILEDIAALRQKFPGIGAA